MDASNSDDLESLNLNQDMQQFNSTLPPSQPISLNTALPYPYQLAKFYTSLNGDSSWPLRHHHPLLENQKPQQLSPHTGPNFQGYRNQVPSEADTNADGSRCGLDSGFYSRPATIAQDSASIIGDEQNPEAQNAAHLMDGFHIGTNDHEFPSWSRQQGSVTESNNGDNKFPCHDCGKSLRTRSEWKKHLLKHNKPFHCDVPQCNRNGGFSTRNDLDRHKRSVHSDASVSGRRFVCRHETCQNKDKVWPRADNFRSHLARIHGIRKTAEDDLGEYLYSQPLSDLQGIGGSAFSYVNPNSQDIQLGRPGDSAYPQSLMGGQHIDEDAKHGLPPPLQFNAALDSLVQGSTYQAPEADHTNLAPVHEGDEPIDPLMLSARPQTLMAGEPLIGSHSLPDNNSIQFQECLTGQSRFSGDNGASIIGQATYSQPDLSDEGESDAEGSYADNSDMAHAASDDYDMKLKDEDQSQSDSLVDSVDTMDEETLMRILRRVPKGLIQKIMDEESGEPDSAVVSQETANSNRAQFKCDACEKSFNRQCELRKHMKRHEKPYGCTWPDCSKAFGSKNDWKRHESIQHYQLETWKCQEQDAAKGEQCSKVCHRRESFRSHLQNAHDVKEHKEIEEKLDKCRIGRHCDRRFWCGFCKKPIQINDESVNAWTLRFNHIDDHFCGRDGKRKVNIKQWEHAPQEPAESADKNACDPEAAPSKLRAISTNGLLKRKPSGDSGPEPHKKSRAAVQTEWKCCQCNVPIPMTTQTTTHCMECQHKQCTMCSVDPQGPPANEKHEKK